MPISKKPPSEPRLGRLLRRIRPQRRAAVAHFVRGLAYGAGLSVASFLTYGIRQML
ncbi:hypothetical protein R6L23_01075 [Streptomyces sp. SR27]|uniref:hypothetical protein n=1 Tax=Streptomyces sp. SR27 TaxID=3076630 RepID=UPI00295BDF50|nr:hypothetical protein [Streptomyces sp. SR27]MDV9186839.1 hypothetical protein [Streptomyces sp. SR27]